jgi:hypothetical protein
MERIYAMPRSLTNLPRWILSLEMALCLLPLTGLFIAVLAMTASGRMPLQYGILAGSGALLGPIGVALAARIVFVSGAAVGRTMKAVVLLLAAWTVLAYSAQIMHGTAFAGGWREFVLLALLPSWAVVHLLRISAERRTLAAMA